jgi:beta-phosphoglucomutase-like phosphatase (HAD superfamily)
MIEAMIFDLDGTLVQTEKLKALSYAKAAVELCPHALGEQEVVEAFKEVVGRSRREVATYLVERFGLTAKSEARMVEFEVDRPWQAFVQVRLGIYEDMLADPEVVRANQWPHNVMLLKEARRIQCKIGLATMSHCSKAMRILEILSWQEVFDFIATLDDVEKGKPDPEIYDMVATELGVDPADCLVIEDSVSGVMAAQAAGMNVVAVATPLTSQSLHASGTLPPELIVDDPHLVAATTRKIFDKYR